MNDLLFLSQRIPYPPEKGDKIRSWNFLQHLARRYRVHVGCFYDDPEDAQHIPFLQTVCTSLCCRPLHPILGRLKSLTGLARGDALTLGYFADAELQRWVDTTLAERLPAHVFVFCSAMAPYVRNYRRGQRILDMVDVDSDKWRQYAATKPWPLCAVYAREHRTLLAFERRMAREFDATLMVSQAEANLFRSLAPESAGRVLAVGNGIDAAYFNPERDYANPFGPEPTIVFTGAMDYWPNIQAVTWFARNVMPLLRPRWPLLQFWIVGANPAPAVQRLTSMAGIVVTGRVDDIRPYLQHATAIVAPLQIARGTQNKVLEAMAMAKPVVATPEACNGIDGVADETVLVASAPEEFADQLQTILRGGLPDLGPRARLDALAHRQWDFTLLDRIMGGTLAVAEAG